MQSTWLPENCTKEIIVDDEREQCQEIARIGTGAVSFAQGYCWGLFFVFMAFFQSQFVLS